jgi:septum formation protein
VKRLILASTSPWRLALLRDAGLRVDAEDPGVDESTIRDGDPAALAVARARAKAEAVAARNPDALVIGADQVAHLDGVPFGKPEDDRAWWARLRSLRGRTHELVTGVALAEGDTVETLAERSRVRFRADVSDEELRAYIAWGEARFCAGGYQAERVGAWLVEAIEGDAANVVGLPIFALLGRLRARGWRLDRLALRSTAPGGS